MTCTEPACTYTATHNLHWQEIATGEQQKRPLCFKHSKHWRDIIKQAQKNPVKFSMEFGPMRYESISSARVSKIRGR